MKLLTFVARIVLVFGLFATTENCQALNPKASASALTVIVTGTASVGAIAQGLEEAARYQIAKIDMEKQKELEGDKAMIGVFSLDFYLDPNKNAVYWADYIGKPDVYMVVEIEGYGSILVPSLQVGYTGGRILTSFLAPNPKAGSTIRIYFLDDDMLGDAVWNNVLQSRMSFFLGTEHLSSEATKDKRILTGMRIGASANGNIQLLDQNVLIDQPDLLAQADIVADETKPLWGITADILDSKGVKVGSLSLSKLDEIKVYGGHLFKAVFWIGLGIVLALVFLKYWRAWTPRLNG